MSHFVSKLVRSGKLPLYFVRFKDLQQQDCWFYVVSNEDKMQQFLAVRSGTFNLLDYGQIVASGFGTEPSPEEKQRLKHELKLSD